MRIIINVKSTAKLSRIEELGRRLDEMKLNDDVPFGDVIESIEKEW